MSPTYMTYKMHQFTQIFRSAPFTGTNVSAAQDVDVVTLPQRSPNIMSVFSASEIIAKSNSKLFTEIVYVLRAIKT